MYKIAVMGDKDSISGFSSIGLDIFPLYDPLEAAKTLRNLSENGYAIIYITEKLYSEINDEIKKYKNNPLPAIIPIPGVSGNNGVGIKNVSKTVEQAVGSDVLK